MSIANSYLDNSTEEIMNDNEINISNNTLSPCVKQENVSLNSDDKELEEIKARVQEMEDESEKLKQLQAEIDKQMQLDSPPLNYLNQSLEEKIEADNRSVYVGNVDYGATSEELINHFRGCGIINRVKIQHNKFDGKPKGFAYIEFDHKDSVGVAMAMDESLLRGRQIKVMPKRTNRPGISTTHRAPRGRNLFRGRGGRGRGSRGFTRPFRRPGRGFYNPY
ncbi:polyadenylate-binding protein 2-like [Aethina tumida]|uniref:polyadenylate-binding protein 2-like n=1 Tax=Aethina tumida TaxID=116153 RepID=UPI00214775C9|nr:polyadenylate-binding protein 2-like [Aethina tumida]